MIKANYFSTNSDLMNHFKKFINWNEVIDAYENDFSDAKEFEKTGNEKLSNSPNNFDEAISYYESILESAGDICGNIVSEHVAEMDRVGAKYENGKVSLPVLLVQSYNKMKEAGLIPYGIQRKYGGLGVPFVVRALLGEILYRVDTSFAIAVGCANLAEILERSASEEMKNEWIPKLANADYVCSMGLTEPNYGSDLPNITTKANYVDGKWLLNGTKRFITQASGVGDIPSIILTLARTGGAGARGLSFFLVQSKDVQIASIEKKLGLHASPTCELVLENTPGLLIGEKGMGLIKYTMNMLNGARMGIASQGVGMAQAGLEEAKKFADSRIQFGKPISEIPSIKSMLRKMEREILAMRLLMIEGGRAVDLYYWRGEHLHKKGLSEKEISNDSQIKTFQKLADFLTPTSKFYCAEMANSVIYDALQIHGGSGFTEDYDIARIFRDARIATIYDGTSQIQVMAAIGTIITGMNETGQLKNYLENLLEEFSSTELLKNLFAEFKSIVPIFKSIEPNTKRESFNSDLVEITARIICSILLEKTSNKLEGNEKIERLELTKEYELDTLSILVGNKAKWQLV
jgi:acyl-CoA dehydrogenase